jgi:Flp pilus assembly protein TadD
MTIMAALGGKPERAWDIMTETPPDLGQLPADMLISASETLLQAGYRNESLALLKTASEHYPNRLRLQTLLASRYAQAGNAAESSALFTALVDQHPRQTLDQREEYGILLAMMGNSRGSGGNAEPP